MNSIAVLGISYIISTLQAHFSQRKLVWNSDADYFPELLKFSSFYLLQFTLNSVFLVIMNNVFNSPREFNQIVIIGILTIVFFFVNKNGVFNVRRRQRQY
jgi:putative flippase GtrA